ncbi:MAG: hypothetical protein A2X05_14155 [Bacteroidetes bacterium GWE2_41_25]|nr:MAG: hypothetical protein A2X03_10985 [Bacteroidetes bacterium GWA2_40_15]OFX95468.1 MAG: hypothetical protein A2X05_14155 [Bacteroidetes bacterium GWE2_41_25]HAM09973.1 hypothetical protein [Bacteroidales bacterium]HBH84442.1 hypothetical protein [Bacteroidales bacterium]
MGFFYCGAVEYKSYTEQYIDSSGIFKDVIITLLSTLAFQEKIRIGERVRAGLVKSRRANTVNLFLFPLKRHKSNK